MKLFNVSERHNKTPLGSLGVEIQSQELAKSMNETIVLLGASSFAPLGFCRREAGVSVYKAYKNQERGQVSIKWKLRKGHEE